MHPRTLSINDFSYELPVERIARFPLPQRDQSRLLVYKEKNIHEDRYNQLASHLPEGALLVFNNTKVVEARILFQKPSGGEIEIFTLEPDDRYKNISEAMEQKGQVWWKCLVGGASKWKHGQVLEKRVSEGNNHFTLYAKITDRLPGSFLMEFEWQPSNLSFSEILQKTGLIPIPPYLKRETTSSDKETYQTIFAKEKGSVAAPTAALHFTGELLESLKQKNVDTAFVTLHVGAGTFMPVKSEQMEGHDMHAEFMEISESFIETLKRKNDFVVPVGTTSLRTIESIYWMGVKCILHPEIIYEALAIQQWEVYDHLISTNYGVSEALEALLTWMRNRGMKRLVIRTRILIAPGYRFQMAAALVTNFHQPKSTLLLLVAALIGEDWKRVYAYALAENFRFLSYGDGCLLYKV